MAGIRDHARIILATIRLANGAVALLVPELMLRRFEGAQQAGPGAAAPGAATGPGAQTGPGAAAGGGSVALYPLRMFGIRTVLLGAQLLVAGRRCGPIPQGGSVRQQGRAGVVIHAADAASAITAGLRRQLPARVAVVAAGISVTNTALAWLLATSDDST